MHNCGVVIELLWSCCGVVMELLWSCYGAVMELLWSCYGVVEVVRMVMMILPPAAEVKKVGIVSF